MGRVELYYEIVSNIYWICVFVLTAYCMVVWIKPFVLHQDKAYRVGIVYVAVMLITKYIPYEMSGMAAYGIGTLTLFLAIWLTDREYIEQKLFLTFVFHCLRWQSWKIVSCINNEGLRMWSSLYSHSTERGIRLRIFDMEWFGLFVIDSVVNLLLGFLIMFGAVRFMLHAYGRKRERMNRFEFVLLIMPAVLGVAAEGLNRYYTNIYWENTGQNVFDYYDGYDFLMMFFLILCFVTILTTTYVFRRWKNEQEEDKQREIFSQQMTDMENHILQAERLYRDMRGLRHDMGNHLMTLERLYSTGEYETAEQYAKALHAEIQDTSSDIKSGNPVTDVILSGRKKEMEEKGIIFDCDFHYPQSGNVDAFDISIILNNGLSNAIEAVERERGQNPDGYFTEYDSEDRMIGNCKTEAHISLASHLVKNMFIIEIINDYTGELMTDSSSGLPLTSKQGEGHGFGLTSIRRVALKYLGDMEIGKAEHEGGEHCVLRVMLQQF